MITKLEARISRLQSELKEAKAARTKEKRKKRAGELIALGIVLEHFYSIYTDKTKAAMKEWTQENLDKKTKERALSAFARLEAKTPLNPEEKQ